MDDCKHVNKFNLAFNHSVLDPQKWHCHTCGTTDTVWACLSCPNVACGILSKGHSFKHFEDTKHALSIEVNDQQSVYCFECGDYVFNDNAASDLKVIRSALSAATKHISHNPEQCTTKRLLRSSYKRQKYERPVRIRKRYEKPERNRKQKPCSTKSNVSDDKLDTAIRHRRKKILREVFRAWKTLVLKLNAKPKPVDVPEKKVKTSSCTVYRKELIPGVTGLRNLGNTCYMNSILQVLGHLDKFRHFFVNMPFPPLSGSCGSSHLLSCPHNMHQSGAINSAANCHNFKNHINSKNTSTECFKRSSPRVGGLNGGATQQRSVHPKLLSISQTIEPRILRPEKKQVSLCEELRSLFEVLWSGGWPVASPNALLQAVWSYIPAFRGYSQQDAQEFLSQLLEKVQTEIGGLCYMKNYGDVVADTFQGELVSEVTCQTCDYKCHTKEKFMDLSLEFPSRYQRNTPHGRIASNVCHITEMLSHFTKPEYLEGKVYACESCNSRRKRSSSSPKIYTEIKKQFKLSKLPHILRLHLKRFRWSKGNHREKIGTHVSFDDFLDMKPFCLPHGGQNQFVYKLSAIIIHHGQGFGSGHYTAFCWSKEANSWVHCNDTRVQEVSMKEVLKCQVYILIFSLHSTGGDHQEDQSDSSSSPTSSSLPRTTLTNSNTNNDDNRNNTEQNKNADSSLLASTQDRDTANNSSTNPNNSDTPLIPPIITDTPLIPPIITDTNNTPTMTSSPSINHDSCSTSTSSPVTPSPTVSIDSTTVTSPINSVLTTPSISSLVGTSNMDSSVATTPIESTVTMLPLYTTIGTLPPTGSTITSPSMDTHTETSLSMDTHTEASPSINTLANVSSTETTLENVSSTETALAILPSMETILATASSTAATLVTAPSTEAALTTVSSTETIVITSSSTEITTATFAPNNTPMAMSSHMDTTITTSSPMHTTIAASSPINLTLSTSSKSYMTLNSPTTSSTKAVPLTPTYLVHTPKRPTPILLRRLGLTPQHIGNLYETRSKLPKLRSSVGMRKSIDPQILNLVDRKRKSDRPLDIIENIKRHRITL